MLAQTNTRIINKPAFSMFFHLKYIVGLRVNACIITFVEPLKVVDKPSKGKIWHLFIH